MINQKNEPMKYFSFLLLVSALFVACGSNQKSTGAVEPKANYDKLVYRFGDASLPPQYHRSYTVTVTETKMNVLVDSYGEKIEEKSFDLKSGDFKGLMDAFTKAGIKNCDMKDEPGCTGGTSEGVTLYNKDAKTFEGSVYHCGGSDSGSLCGDTKALIAHIKGMVIGFPLTK